MEITAIDLKEGIEIEVDGELHQVIEFQHVKPGKGAAYIRSKVRNTKTGEEKEMDFDFNQRLQIAELDK